MSHGYIRACIPTTQVSPLQVLKGRYTIQYVAARSHKRADSNAGDLEEAWLQALFREFTNVGS